jgi:hypothetical protein
MDDTRQVSPEIIRNLAEVPDKIEPLRIQVSCFSATRDLNPRAASALARAHNLLMAAQSAIKDAVSIQGMRR